MSDVVQELLDREAIKELKARYFRSVDAKDWDAFRGVFTDDLRVQIMDGDPIEGADAFVTFARQALGGARSAHHGHMPEIDFDSPTEARGIWSFADYIEWPADPETGARRGMKGYGNYHETYRKDGGDWRIASLRLVYRRMDPLYPEPLPEQILGGPALLEEATL